MRGWGTTALLGSGLGSGTTSPCPHMAHPAGHHEHIAFHPPQHPLKWLLMPTLQNQKQPWSHGGCPKAQCSLCQPHCPTVLPRPTVPSCPQFQSSLHQAGRRHVTEAKPNHGSQRPHGEKALVSPQFKRKPALARQGTEDSRIFNYLFILFSIVLGGINYLCGRVLFKIKSLFKR